MGLLTNEANVSRLSKLLLNHGDKICALSYVIGLVWYLSLAHPSQNGKAYFSENALLPGLVDSDLHHDFGAKNYVAELQQLLINNYSNDEIQNSIPIEWFRKKFVEAGLEVHTQNYSFKYPYAGPNKHLKGENLYAIIRAPRAAGVESIVLSAPFRSETSTSEATYPGLALMVALAKAFRAHSYWAKDIIFLITDNEEIGIQAWLASYHHSHTEYIKYDELTARAGSIQAAINLELNSELINKIDLRILGLNGQLPNLDLVNTASRLCQREYVQTTFQNRRNVNNRNTLNGYLWSLETMLTMMWRQSSGAPSGNHGYFNKYGIEAVTLHGVKTNANKRHGLLQVGRIIEGILRSLNNLLERFHQSFFFYILPSTDRYISIGVYMPPFGLILLPVIIKLFSLWVSMMPKDTVNEKKTKQEDNIEKEMNDEVTTEVLDDKSNDENAAMIGIFSCISVLLICGLFGFGVMYACKKMVQLAEKLHVEANDAILMVFLAAHFCMIMCPFVLLRNASNVFNAKLLKCISLFLFALLIGCISLINISFATFVAVVSVPLVVLVKPIDNQFLLSIQRILLLLITPISIIFLSSLASYTIQNYKSKSTNDVMSMLFTSWIGVKSGLLSSSLQYEMLGCWTFAWLCLLIMPLWMLHWIVTFGVWK